MSFKFNWDSFNDENFYERARSTLTDALNKGKMPPILSDRIVVRELYLGEESPQLEILEIGDLAADMFRGIFKLTYNGEASITLATKVQANPLKVYGMSAPSFCTPKFMGASAPLDIPLNLTLSDIRLSGIIIVVFSKAKGLTLVFRNDPLQSIRVSSTFDALPGIARFLQGQIENQIRSLFREELPAILHKLSHRWTPNGGLVLHKGAIENSSSGVDDDDKCEGENATPAKVMFMDINPEMPVLSRSNMLKINTIGLSQRTLSLFTPSLPETVYRANLESSEEHYAGVYSIQKVAGGVNELAEIARIQSRNYFRNAHSTPKRRVIKLNSNNSSKKDEHKQTTKAPAPAPATKPNPSTAYTQTVKPPTSILRESTPVPHSQALLSKIESKPLPKPSASEHKSASFNNNNNNNYSAATANAQPLMVSHKDSQTPVTSRPVATIEVTTPSSAAVNANGNKDKKAGKRRHAPVFIAPPPAYAA